MIVFTQISNMNRTVKVVPQVNFSFFGFTLFGLIY